MNILLTNDDGILCEGLLRLAEGLRQRTPHRIYVVAPDSNRSGVSHAISLRTPVKLKARGVDTWVCSGSPADCVMVSSLGALPFKPELLISGINLGPNLGTDIIFSGTAAAARQAALHHIPAIALSLAAMADPLHWDGAVSFAVTRLDELRALWKEDTFLNVNLPNLEGGAQELAITFPARRRYHDGLITYPAPDDYTYCFVDLGPVRNEEEAGSDCDAVSRNVASVSPVFLHPVVRKDLCAGVPPHAGVAPRPGAEPQEKKRSG